MLCYDSTFRFTEYYYYKSKEKSLSTCYEDKYIYCISSKYGLVCGTNCQISKTTMIQSTVSLPSVITIYMLNLILI